MSGPCVEEHSVRQKREREVQQENWISILGGMEQEPVRKFITRPNHVFFDLQRSIRVDENEYLKLRARLIQYYSGLVDGSCESHQEVVKRILPLSFKLALDVGCGEGKKLRWLAREGKKVVGIDISIPALSRSKDLGVLLVKADAVHLPFKGGVFDTLLVTEVLEHIPNFDGLLEELKRVSSPRAGILISVPNYLNLMGVKKWLCETRSGQKNSFSPWRHHVYEKSFISIVLLRRLRKLLESFRCYTYYGENLGMSWICPLPRKGPLRYVRRLLWLSQIGKLTGWRSILRNSPLSFIGMHFFVYFERNGESGLESQTNQ